MGTFKITNDKTLLEVANQQPEPQRFLFVFLVLFSWCFVAGGRQL